MSKAKQIGTMGETRVVKWLHQLGFYKADRVALHGTDDIADILIDPDIPGVIEMKWRSPARSSDGVKHRTSSNASTADIKRWLGETVREANNRGGHWGVLMVNEFGKADPGDWRVYIPHYFSEARILVPRGEFKMGLGEFSGWYTIQMSGRDFMEWLISEYGTVLAERKRAHYDGEI